MEQGDRVSHHAAAQNLLNGHGLVVLGPGVAHGMASVLHCHLGHLLVGHAELVLVAGGRHAVDAGHRIALGAVGIRGNGTDGPVEMGSHGLDAESQNPLVPAHLHRFAGFVERGRAAGAGVLNGDNRYLHDADLLEAPGNRPRIAEYRARVDRVDVGGLQPSIVQRLDRGLPG